MTELRKRLNMAKVLTKVELKNRYHLVYMVEEGDEKTGFHTRFRIYYWRVILFGLCNAPATFQSMMDNIFHNLIDNGIIPRRRNSTLTRCRGLPTKRVPSQLEIGRASCRERVFRRV